ncbi:hypothetical protein TNCV_4762331 [Trichonephila clavipes]|nr:hypothetical protein TNCV_4762331 [Trichonephila clavipes]
MEVCTAVQRDACPDHQASVIVMDDFSDIRDQRNVQYIGYVKGVHSSQITLGNSTPSLRELAGSISAVWLFIRNLLGLKPTLIRGQRYR